LVGPRAVDGLVDPTGVLAASGGSVGGCPLSSRAQGGPDHVRRRGNTRRRTRRSGRRRDDPANLQVPWKLGSAQDSGQYSLSPSLVLSSPRFSGPASSASHAVSGKWRDLQTQTSVVGLAFYLASQSRVSCRAGADAGLLAARKGGGIEVDLAALTGFETCWLASLASLLSSHVCKSFVVLRLSHFARDRLTWALWRAPCVAGEASSRELRSCISLDRSVNGSRRSLTFLFFSFIFLGCASSQDALLSLALPGQAVPCAH
jgi:hypothetical protein